MSVPGQGLLDHISEVHVVFSNTDLLSIYMKQPSVPFFLTDPLTCNYTPLHSETARRIHKPILYIYKWKFLDTHYSFYHSD